MKRLVKDFMRKDIPSVGLGTTLDKVKEVMAQEGVDFVLVKEKQEIVGVISDTDVLAYLSRKRGAGHLRSESFMTSCKIGGLNPCLQVFVETPVEDAIAIMATTGVNHLLVYEHDGHPAGVVVAADILKKME